MVRHATCPGDPGDGKGARFPGYHCDFIVKKSAAFSALQSLDTSTWRMPKRSLRRSRKRLTIFRLILLSTRPVASCWQRLQIARAVEAHPAKVTAYVPVYAMSGGTLIALAADEIVMGEFSVLGPIDPQILGLPAASIVRARDSKPIADVFDLTLVLADVGEKAVAQVSRELLS